MPPSAQSNWEKARIIWQNIRRLQKFEVEHRPNTRRGRQRSNKVAQMIVRKNNDYFPDSTNQLAFVMQMHLRLWYASNFHILFARVSDQKGLNI
jgi:hypothetical protein